MSEKLVRLKSIKALPGSKLKLVWSSDGSTSCDLTGLIARSLALSALSDARVFALAKVVDRGAAVRWPKNVDLSAQTLRQISREQEVFDDKSFRAWQVELDLSNRESADALGVTRGTIRNYRNGNGIPLAVAVACRAMMNDPHVIAAHFNPRKPGRPFGSRNSD